MTHNTSWALSELHSSNIRTETETVGATFVPSAAVTNDLRFNYSRTEARGSFGLDQFGGAVPLVSLPFPSPYNSRNALLGIDIGSLLATQILVGKDVRNVQRQFNIVDTLSLQRGSHSVKVGVDYRRVSPISSPLPSQQLSFF